MLIAFEGPDNVGKSSSAKALSWSAGYIYNATKDNYRQAVEDIADEPDAIIAFDRIDWLSHMVYRLAMPSYEWNDERPRTVFAMPDAHLVIKLHRPDLAQHISDELYGDGDLVCVNAMYSHFANFLAMLNRERNYDLFKTVSVVEVSNDPRYGTFSQRLISFDSPSSSFGAMSYSGYLLPRLVDGDESLRAWLRADDARRS